MVEKRPLTADIRVQVPLWATLIPLTRIRKLNYHRHSTSASLEICGSVICGMNERETGYPKKRSKFAPSKFGRVHRGGKPKLPSLKALSRGGAEVACLAITRRSGVRIPLAQPMESINLLFFLSINVDAPGYVCKLPHLLSIR